MLLRLQIAKSYFTWHSEGSSESALETSVNAVNLRNVSWMLGNSSTDV